MIETAQQYGWDESCVCEVDAQRGGELLFTLDKLQSTFLFLCDLFGEIGWRVGILGWENCEAGINW